MNRRLLLRNGLSLSALAAVGCAGNKPGGAAPEALTTEGTGEPDIAAAFNYAFTLYEFARTAQDRTGAVGGNPGRLNTVVHRAQLMDYTSRQVTAPNNDTIYSSAFLELSGGPVELIAPSSSDRYYSIQFMDAFTDNFAYIGTRATGGRGGRFWIVGPQWRGQQPAGVGLIRSSTNDVWMLLRALVDGPSDLPAAQAFQQGLSISTLPGRLPARPFAAEARDVTDPHVFLSVVSDVLRRSPGGAGETARAAMFAKWGLGSGEVSPQLIERWRNYLPEGLAALKEAFLFRDLMVDGWSYQPRGIGNFGSNDKLRAAVALGGIAALGEQEAMYFHANFDAGGESLTGERTYRWRVPAGGVPVNAFWSLTMYRAYPDGRYFLVENPIGRYAIGDRTKDLAIDADGSLEILIQHQQPVGRLAANWLPAPEGRMRLALRAYLPKQELIERTWRVPPLVRLS